MSTVCVVAPPQWGPLVDALEGAGHGVVALLGDAISPNAAPSMRGVLDELGAFGAALDLAGPAAILDLQKTGKAIGVDPAFAAQFAKLHTHLTTAYGVRRFVEQAARVHGATAVVVVCTCDVPGRAALAGARGAGVPLVHVQHACPSDPPEAAWFVGEEPGDLVLVPGERDRAWWAHCNPEANVRVTGNPLWDRYHGMAQPERPDPPVVLWADQSPTNQEAQTADYWASRAVPDLAWRAFLRFVDQAEGLGGVIFKGRGREPEGYAEGRWQALADACERQSVWCRRFEGAPADILPEASLVVCQDSNLGVEALHLGIPVVSITRPGSGLFDLGGALVVDGVSPHLAEHLAEAIREATRFSDPTREFLVEMAATYNRGAADGQSMARVVAAIGDVAAGRLVK